MAKVAKLHNPVRDALLEWEENQQTIRELQARNKELAATLKDAAAFEQGKQTGRLFVDGFSKVTVTVPKRLEWDMTTLEKARKEVGDDTFFGFFRWEYKHKDARLLAMAPKEIMEAQIVKEGAPQIKIER